MKLAGIVLFLAFTASVVPALAGGRAVIEESFHSSGGVGGGITINRGTVGGTVRITPETHVERRTTITTWGDINVFGYRPGCEPPCDYRGCYPQNHPCYPCNRYQSPPCPNIVIK